MNRMENEEAERESLGHLDMSKWVNSAHTGWLTMSRVENEWTQPGSLYGELEIL